jgi:hypothetical protein
MNPVERAIAETIVPSRNYRTILFVLLIVCLTVVQVGCWLNPFQSIEQMHFHLGEDATMCFFMSMALAFMLGLMMVGCMFVCLFPGMGSTWPLSEWTRCKVIVKLNSFTLVLLAPFCLLAPYPLWVNFGRYPGPVPHAFVQNTLHGLGFTLKCAVSFWCISLFFCSLNLFRSYRTRVILFLVSSFLMGVALGLLEVGMFWFRNVWSDCLFGLACMGVSVAHLLYRGACYRRGGPSRGLGRF